MSKITYSTYTKFEQTDEEQLTGQVLTQSQKENIQNQICTLAEARLAITPDPNNYASFIQEEANYKGQIQALQYLLDCSLSVENMLLEHAQNQAIKQTL